MPIRVHSRPSVLPTALLLLLIAASRIVQLGDLPVHLDEAWSVWTTFGTPQQIVAWTPYTYSPLYYLSLGAWRLLVGETPLLMRLLNVFVFLLGSACLYRLALRLMNRRAAIVATLVYAALGYNLYISMQARLYAFAIALLPLAFWMTLRYFDQPTFRRALALGLCLAGMIYAYLTGVLALGLLGLYTLLFYPRRVWRWWLPGLIGLIVAAPEIIRELEPVASRVAASSAARPPLAPFFPAMGEFFSFLSTYLYIGYPFILWVLIFALALGAILYTERPLRRQSVFLLFWVFGMAILVYLSHPYTDLFRVFYAWWIGLGLALLIGRGIAHLPRPGAAAVLAALAVPMFIPFPLNDELRVRPLIPQLAWLAEHAQWGDAVVVDPECACVEVEELDLYGDLYFPNGLSVVHDPEGYRRVWYFTSYGFENPVLAAQVRAGRIASRFVGPVECLFRLYEGPPDAAGIPFENGMRFHGVEIMEGERPWPGLATRREGETIRLRLWWSADRAPALDYSVSSGLLGTGGPLAQFDGPPQTISLEYGVEPPPRETSRWTPGRFYVEERELRLPDAVVTQTAVLYLVVYFWQDAVPIPAPGTDENGLLRIGTVSVKAW